MDEQNTAYTDTVAVWAWDRDALDTLLQAKWNAMKDALATGDIDEALNYFDQGAKPIFEYNFNALHDHLEEVVAGLESIAIVKAIDTQAEYNLLSEQNGQEFSFYLLFEKDGQGIWRLKFF